MQTKLLLIRAACVLGASACAHVQSAELDPSAAEPTTAPALASPSTVDTTGAQQSPADNSKLATPIETSPSLAPPSEEQPGDTLTKEASPTVASADDAQALPAGADDHPPTDGEPLARFVLSRSIENREPVDEDVTFKPGERVYAFLEVANPDGDEYALSLRWARDEGDLGQPTAVTIGNSPRWRTWSWRRAPEQPGSYRCFIETQNGEQVAEIPFRVEG